MRTFHLESLRAATSDQEVVRLAQDYLALWSPEELSSIPRHCRPGHVREAEEIADAAMELTRARIGSFEEEALLTEMETFFAQACVRLSQLEAASARSRDADVAAR